MSYQHLHSRSDRGGEGQREVDLQSDPEAGDRNRKQSDAILRTDRVAQAKAPSSRAGKKAPARKGGGAALDAETQEGMEESFGTSFADVRVHEDGNAEQLGAVAYAQGSHIHMRAGAYQPGTDEGDALIGHELTHVVQQRAGRVAVPQGKGTSINADESLESEADEQGAAAAAGEKAEVGGSSAPLAPKATEDEADEGEGEEPVQAKLDWTSSRFRSKTGTGKSFKSEEWKNIIRALEAYDDLPDTMKTSIGGFDSKTVLGVLEALRKSGLAWLGKHDKEKPKKKAKDAKRATVVEDIVYKDVPQELGAINSGMGTAQTVKKLGGGQVGSVHLVDFGGEQKIFKDQEKGYEGGAAPAAFSAGIPEDHNSNLGNRAVASSKLDELFKTDVLTKTEFGTRSGEDGKEVKGISMDIAGGQSPQRLEGEQTFQRQMDYSNPEVQRQLATLQLLDAITGQVDRHGGNFFIEFQGDQVKVKGIDNDLAFGKNKQDISQDQSGDDKYRTFPAYVDKEVASNIRKIKEDQIRAVLQPLLQPSEVEATLVRFRQVLQFLNNMENMNPSHVISKDKWNEQTAQAFDHKSYFGAAKGLYEDAQGKGTTLGGQDPNVSKEDQKTNEDEAVALRMKMVQFNAASMMDMKQGQTDIWGVFGVEQGDKNALAAAIRGVLQRLEQVNPSLAGGPWIKSQERRVEALLQ